MPKLPYRPCVGVMLVNRDGLAFVGKRAPGGNEPTENVWQMPQGGIDEGEDPYEAALRELYEETNASSVELIGSTKGWVTYDLPPELVGVAWKGKYCGQKQKWFALRFTGKDKEIDVKKPGGGKHRPEFEDWRWEKIEKLPGLIVPFKRAAYEEVVAELLPLVKA
ncbi:RNA pyrophosphohydrolase [Terrihabitans soli]|uniref:RNA pyrophosphohydrolase n=1 Tax=Terrihabitans soli TaxID=708113 RepID=A0A6S6QQT5_9HYPH|nr:RNA pyrophosphohydrolase [Terrihabitans soli]BCJ89421.1 RNA pyrophosphohydrolase [Terrihabitans soli]